LLKRLFFVAPVAAAALSLSAVTAFANGSPGPGSADCVALSNQQASQKAKLDQDQDALNLAKQEVVNLQGVVDKDSPVDVAKMKHDKDALAAAQNKVTNLQGIVQKDSGDLQQTQNQTTNQNVCNGTAPPSGGSGAGSPAPKTDGQGSAPMKDDKNKGRHGPSYTCVAISNERAAQSAKLEQDQDALNVAKQKLANLQGEAAKHGDAKAMADNEVKNRQKIVQADKANLSQNQTQNTTQNVCNTSTTNNYYTTNVSGSGAGSGTPSGSGSGSSSGSGSGSGEPGLPQTGVA
jgi:hypothetical protein